MLQTMREKTQGLIAGAIAVVIALTFALWGVQNYLHGGRESQIAAKVNGKEITRAQENIAYEQLKRSEMMRLGRDFSLDQKIQAQLKKGILQQLIKREVVLQALSKMDLGIGKEQLWAIVGGLPIFQVNGRFSIDAFKQVTERFFSSQQAFLEGLKYSYLQTQLEEGIVDTAFVLPEETQAIKKILLQRRDFRYIIISPDLFTKTIQVTDADVQKYYEQHQSEFTIPEKISLQYIELSSSILRNKVKTSAEQLKQYYQDNISSFSTPKKWQVVRVLLPLSHSTDTKVADAAQKKLLQLKADDDLTKIADAQISKVWLTRSDIEMAFAAPPDKLTIGQMSKPFLTRDGYVREKILVIQPETVMSYQSVAGKVKQAYEHQQLAQLFSEANDKLIDLTYTNSDSLEPAAKELGLKIQKTDLITSTTSVKNGILANNKVINAAFSEAVLKQGYNSNPIEIEPGRLVVLRIKDHIPETVQPFDQVRSAITTKLQAQAMQKKAQDFSQELMTVLQKDGSITEHMQQYNLIWQTITGAGYDNADNNAQLLEAAFSLPHPTANEIAAMVVELPGEYAVLQVLKVYDGKMLRENPKQAEFIKSLPEQLGHFEYQLLVDKLMSKAKIKIFSDAENK